MLDMAIKATKKAVNKYLIDVFIVLKV
jgi:hypothetical protein